MYVYSMCIYIYMSKIDKTRGSNSPFFIVYPTSKFLCTNSNLNFCVFRGFSNNLHFSPFSNLFDSWGGRSFSVKACTTFPATSAWMVPLDCTFELSLPWTVLQTFRRACIRFGAVHHQAILQWLLMAMPIWGLAREFLYILLFLTPAPAMWSKLKVVSQLITLDEVVTICILATDFSKASWQLRCGSRPGNLLEKGGSYRCFDDWF